ncbi:MULTISPECIES: short-chain fatty acid transporter [Aneurinibacillus]|uniref:Short-chain fatty acids transporter n=1 Tax=Aneurinibacillus thermoaerophilus TaxID=143495 RepID=A0A1G8ECE8_ANETH|nr:MULTISPECIES: TIGR00366 family protein [Aneurinibacillus]AMA72397.1 short-chain fatty acid transporter [Aneurinibacillus sp. XH2]MED0679869.1 TIGR00366 family protein [Aneurinibacillus thermoaerophilus]MED0737891.1 TIGR00366 family protein [Aneurinibacillus thermoaerophilus]MED0759026.1 TIGR00366 family protein [Aneurinibacillus thermoaerophilus]MED0762685.1 TIGR00366 family protein [Aneurinibacillus thermoaerophilus]
MLVKIADIFSKVVRRYLPDAFVIAILMTLFVFIIAILMNLSDPMTIFKAWGDGFWKYLAFTMQMVLVLMTGMVLASVPFINKALQKVASIPKTPTQAYVMTFIISAISYYINWGLAVVVGAIFAKEVAKRNEKAHFPLLVASAYSPTALYAAGLSSSIGLTIATPDHFLAKIMGVVPTSETIFHPGTIIIFLALFITMPIVIAFMAPKTNIISYKPLQKNTVATTETAATIEQPLTPAEKLEMNPWLGTIMGACGFVYVVYKFFEGLDLNLDIINLTFLSAGLFFHRSLGRFAAAFKEAATSISSIILQFPFYAGIIAILTSSGMGEAIINWMSSVASKDTFTIFTYWTAGLVNLFAPSGGGQWALQGPLQIPAGMQLGVEPGKIAMAVAWGDAWTNLIQPFWALPILGVVGLSIRDIMGYCVLLSIWVGVVTSILIMFVY